MAVTLIDLTTPQPGGKFGDPTKTAWEKANDNFEQLEAAVDESTEASTAAVTRLTVLEGESGASQISTTVIPSGSVRTVADIASKDIMVSVSNSITLPQSSDVRAQIQAALDAAALSDRAGRREVVFRARGEYRIDGHIVVPRGIRLVFDGDSRVLPMVSSSGLQSSNGMRSYGSLPTVTYTLSVDARFGEYKLSLGANATAFTPGDYVWISSSANIDTSPNMNGIKRAQMARVLDVTAGVLTLDRLLEYDFAVSETSVGVADVMTGVRIENFVFGDPTMAVRAGRGMDFRMHDGLVISDCDVGWSRTSATAGAGDMENVNSLNLVSCCNVQVNRLKANRVGWYGISVDGASHFVNVSEFSGHLVRHGVSLNWNGPSEPVHVLVKDSQCSVSSFAGFDAHDVGRDYVVRNCKSSGSITDGFQTRVPSTVFENCVAEGCAQVGVRTHSEDLAKNYLVAGVKIVNFTARKCAVGISAVAACDVSGADISGCTSAGVQTMGGVIRDSKIVDSNIAIVYHDANRSATAKAPLLVDALIAPASAAQNTFMQSTQSYLNTNLRLRDCTVPGYSVANRLTRTAGQTYIEGADHTGCAWGANAREGSVTLANGTATVTNDNSFIGNSATATRVFRSHVLLTRLTQGSGGTPGSPGELSVIQTATGFTITSSSATDNGVIEWKYT